jgi:ribosomal protein L14
MCLPHWCFLKAFDAQARRFGKIALADCAGGRKAVASGVVDDDADKAVEEVGHVVGVIGVRRAKPTRGARAKTQAAIYIRWHHMAVELKLLAKSVD